MNAIGLCRISSTPFGNKCKNKNSYKEVEREREGDVKEEEIKNESEEKRREN